MAIELDTFYAGKGINATKLNSNFEKLKNQTNDNQTAIENIASTALLKDGSNITQEMITKFKTDTITTLSTQGDISLEDGKDYILTLTGAGKIKLPSITSDNYSHTITMIVMGGSFSLDLSEALPVMNPDVSTTNPYSVLFIFNKINNRWYYFLGQ